MDTPWDFTGSGGPKIVVGKYTIRESIEGSVFIECSDGEGAQFSKSLFEKNIDEFYNKNF